MRVARLCEGRPAPAGVTGEARRDPESGASRVFVLDRRGTPLMPCHPARARKLLAKGRAVVVRLHPFTIRLRDRTSDGETQEVGLKIDPGAKTTGLALVREDGEVLFLAEITHRGARIRKAMQQRSNCRRRRRSANLRYRKKRFLNRRSGGKLPPSLQSRVDNVVSWTERLRRWAPVTSIACESVRFDTQAMENPEIQGAEYQQGTLAGYEVREYLLEKWGRTCAYCGATDTPLQVDHVRPRARGGSDRVSNLTLACRSCNQAKGAQPVEAFLARPPGASPEGSGAGEGAAGRGRRRQRHPPRPVRGIEADGASRHRPLGRADEVQPHAAGDPEVARP